MNNQFSDEIFQKWKEKKSQMEIIHELKMISTQFDPFKTLTPHWSSKLQEMGWLQIHDPYSFTNHLLKILERENSL